MAIDPTWTASTEARIVALEKGMTSLLRLLKSCVGQEQFNRINVVIQKQITKLEEELTNLEAEVKRLDTEFDSLL